LPKLQPFKLGTGPGTEDGTAAWYYNGKYQVTVRKELDHTGAPVVCLSVRREDRKPIADWRDMQWVKNQLLGPEEEMMQVFPAESRLVDTSNQYWFWCYPGRRLPVGFTERLVSQTMQVRATPDGAFSKQRPFGPDHLPADIAEQEEKGRRMLQEFGAKEVERE